MGLPAAIQPAAPGIICVLMSLGCRAPPAQLRYGLPACVLCLQFIVHFRSLLGVILLSFLFYRTARFTIAASYVH